MAAVRGLNFLLDESLTETAAAEDTAFDRVVSAGAAGCFFCWQNVEIPTVIITTIIKTCLGYTFILALIWGGSQLIKNLVELL